VKICAGGGVALLASLPDAGWAAVAVGAAAAPAERLWLSCGMAGGTACGTVAGIANGKPAGISRAAPGAAGGSIGLREPVAVPSGVGGEPPAGMGAVRGTGK